ncbi:MAG: RecQ family ATP-dependent DNA helicase, partial [Dehalococcoidia bacterium]
MTQIAVRSAVAETHADYPSPPPGDDLLGLLNQHFGYESFRPLQRQIIADAIDGRDVFALLPTGAGKSICFQLPALARNGMTVVASPLIALMKDQVDALHSRGIGATAINSSLPYDEIQERYRRMSAGEYSLVYVAPERLMQPEFLSSLKRLPVSTFAIDEAHCISQWGHDFRPEYRRLSELRTHFPAVPIMALTATATERVRSDIAAQLGLRDPAVHVASFNRPNLHYAVTSRDKAYERILEALRSSPQAPGIIYCQTRRSTDALAERLRSDGIRARAYHAGMSSDERRRHQEMFLSDKARVICATVAFGMGIDKPNVRFVIHHGLPKNIESYYQETGRAGRDGEPSRCILFFAKGDAVRLRRFADEMENDRARQLAIRQIDDIVAFADSKECRRKLLLAYFGETYGEQNCDACDNCRPKTAPAVHDAGADEDYDETLFQRLKALRKRLADERDVPAYVVFHDTTLKAISRALPANGAALARIKGIGTRKLQDYGMVFLQAVKDHASRNGTNT